MQWGQLAASQDSEDYKASSPVPASPCCPPRPAGQTDVISFSTPTELVQGLCVDGDRGAVKSPIMAALFLDGRHKARVLAQASRHPAAAEAQHHPAEPEVGPEQHRSSQEQLPPKDVEDIVQQQCQRALAAAGSSSRGCLDLLCWGIACDMQQCTAAASPVTPPTAGLDLLPAPPRKRSAVVRALPATRVVLPCRAARMLPGLAPTSEGELDAVRAWMTVQKAQ